MIRNMCPSVGTSERLISLSLMTFSHTHLRLTSPLLRLCLRLWRQRARLHAHYWDLIRGQTLPHKQQFIPISIRIRSYSGYCVNSLTALLFLLEFIFAAFICGFCCSLWRTPCFTTSFMHASSEAHAVLVASQLNSINRFLQQSLCLNCQRSDLHHMFWPLGFKTKTIWTMTAIFKLAQIYVA